MSDPPAAGDGAPPVSARRTWRERWQALRPFGTPLAYLAIGLAVGGLLVEIRAAIADDDLERQIRDAEHEIARLASQELPRGGEVTAELGCPAVERVRLLAGVEVVSDTSQDEPCRYRWTNDRDGEDVSVVCPVEYLCTFELTNERIWVMRGTGVAEELPIRWGNWRFLPAYPLDARHRDECGFLRDEQNYFIVEDGPAREVPARLMVIPRGYYC